MKKIFVISVLLLSIILAGCGHQVYTCPDGSTSINPDDCVKMANEMANKAQEQLNDITKKEGDILNNFPVKDVQTQTDDSNTKTNIDTNGGLNISMDPEVEKFKEKATKITNYEFLYAVYPENKATRTYFVKYPIVKVKLYKTINKDDKKFDTIYLNYDTKQTVSYCEEIRTCGSDTKSIVGHPKFDDYYIKLPHQYMEELTNGKIIGPITFDGHSAIRISSFIDDKKGVLTLQKFYGVPLRIYFSDDDGMEFRDMAFNTNKDLIPPSGW